MFYGLCTIWVEPARVIVARESKPKQLVSDRILTPIENGPEGLYSIIQFEPPYRIDPQK